MGSSKIRSQFDELDQLAGIYGGQAESTRKLLQRLKQQQSVLQDGAWVGKGAKAFYAEMDNKLTPAIASLAGALDGASDITKKISQVMQQAEREVTRLFAAELAEAIMAAGAGAIAGAAAAAAAGAAGGVAGAAAAVAAAAKAATRAAEDAAVDSMLSKFSPKVREMVKNSPTLRSEMLTLQQQGFKINTGPIAGGSATNSGKKQIVIGQPDSDTETVAGIAHETGHALSTLPSSISATPTMTKAKYVKANVDNMMLNEGGAQFNAAQVRAELNKAGGPDIGIPGTQTAKYQQVYDNYVAGKITKNEAVSQMGTLMGNERTSTPPVVPYHKYYGDWYSNNWDKHIAPGRKAK